jgi:hypothetical protein
MTKTGNPTKREQLQQSIRDAKSACKDANQFKLRCIKQQREAKEQHKQARAALAAAQAALVAFDNGGAQ